ncbi:MAG: twin-arginine translocase TatA/TatE family subunit [Lentisphaerae bacterium]|jgi:sec-independent protein translocase protein TatA|nr:twin-arginine translocase TatA/TatE family subunit [Lentisphaerota bacterium]MBT4818410.1 twin-arginine translocase TatA/TatE family subunit [Lentisphaerota bacterium]MBT5610688.1 twin-arginine translocase TatA/TatE family subunit [Lentisphaerota bacterium]MBT7058044.1 twin-arginine translocase TatA/TatE family subunit [Lentisphaerota bacterium]MBT7840666.1 twin-arginine translocase TatA/TatE family subunit [Lentisphaerota bacterium]
MTPGWRELMLIFLIVLLVFGGKKLPEIARGLGQGIKEFKKAKDDIRDAIEEETMYANTEADIPASGDMDDTPAPANSSTPSNA